MVFKIDEEKYRRSLDYEILTERITYEMACWNSLRYDVGKDTEQGRRYFEVMMALVKLDKSIYVDDESTIQAARSSLRDIRAERKKIENRQSDAYADLHWKGWQKIYNKYCAKLNAVGAKTISAKEKYGALQIDVCEYEENADMPEILRLIDEAERASETICENCGESGNICENNSGWLKTLCEKCAKQFLLPNQQATVSVPPESQQK